MLLNQRTRQPEASQEEASQEEEKKVNGDMASAWEELDDVQLATVVGGFNWVAESKRWERVKEDAVVDDPIRERMDLDWWLLWVGGRYGGGR